MSVVAMKSLQGGRCTISAVAGASVVMRHKHTRTGEHLQQQQEMHQSVTSTNTLAPAYVTMPPNVEELQASEKARFSRRRTRDISSKLNQMCGVFGSGFMGDQGAQGSAFNSASHPVDSHMDVYDSRVTVSLSSVMQTTVPKPFEITGKAPTHLNMPGGQWAQDDKYISGDLHDHHYSNITSKKTPGTSHVPSASSRIRSSAFMSELCGLETRGLVTWCGGGSRVDTSGSLPRVAAHSNTVHVFPNKAAICGGGLLCTGGTRRCSRYFHVCAVCNTQDSPATQELTSRQKLKRAVKEYGATVIVFHVTISLASLGICYLLVSSGVDMTGIIKSLGINLDMLTKEAGAGAGQVTAVVEGIADEAAVQDAAHLQHTDLAEATEDEMVKVSDSSGITAAVEESIKNTASSDVDVSVQRAAGAATFVVAYAVHKVFAPARIAVTLTATPFIVRHLRRIGFLKPPKQKAS